MVDAASEHLERPSPWLVRGADLVVYSGGKFLRGPQTSGLLLGSKSLVKAAWANASPHQALGRPMKVSKEDIIGVLAAVEYWFEERDHAAERQKWYDDLAVIAERVGRLPGARGDIIEPSGVDRVPLLRISWQSDYLIDGLELRQRVLDGEPRIMLDDNSATENSIEIDPFQLHPGEAAQVGDAIAAVLREARSGKAAPALSPPVAVAGDWELHVDFLQGSRVHRLNIEQRGAELSGHQRSAWFEGPVSGRLRGDLVQFSFNQRYEGSNISYLFDGTVRDGQMKGTVALGAATEHHAGIVNRSQFGTGRWQASRVT
jgi:L-seryl-tRNA(Ser) seleniumtransferase